MKGDKNDTSLHAGLASLVVHLVAHQGAVHTASHIVNAAQTAQHAQSANTLQQIAQDGTILVGAVRAGKTVYDLPTFTLITNKKGKN